MFDCGDRRPPAPVHPRGGALHGGPLPGAGRGRERDRPVEVCRRGDRPPLPGGVQRLQHHLHHFYPHVCSQLCGRYFEGLCLKAKREKKSVTGWMRGIKCKMTDGVEPGNTISSRLWAL